MYLNDSKDDGGHVESEDHQLTAHQVPEPGDGPLFFLLFLVSTRTARNTFLHCHSTAQFTGLLLVVNTIPSHVLRSVKEP